MKILVSGATGFVGRPLVSKLVESGHTVHYLARKRSEALDSLAGYLSWSRTDQEPELGRTARFDAVVHLAGESVAQRWSPEVKRRILDSRVLGTRNLVRSLATLPEAPAALVSASAIGYYGNRDADVLTEESGPGKGFLAELCVVWEHEALAAREFGMRVVTLRIGMVLAAGGGALGPMLPVFRAGFGGRLASGRQWMSWIDRQDLIGLLEFSLDNSAVAGALNATSPNPVTNQEFTRVLGNALRRPTLFPVPRVALRLALGEFGQHILDSARVLPAAAQKLGYRFQHSDLQASLAAIVEAR